MQQQQLGAIALITVGILVAIGSSSAAVRRWRLPQRMREPRWSRLLATLATVGLSAGFVTMGLYTYGPPLPEPMWLAQVAECGFALAVAGYALTITPTVWRALWAN